MEQEIPEVLFWPASFRFLLPGIQTLSRQKEYPYMLEEYKNDQTGS